MFPEILFSLNPEDILGILSECLSFFFPSHVWNRKELKKIIMIKVVWRVGKGRHGALFAMSFLSLVG